MKIIFQNWNLISFYRCRLKVIDATPFSNNQNQLRSLYVEIENCLFLYVNNQRIPKGTLIRVAPLENQNTIPVRAVGIFQSKTIDVPVGNQRIVTHTKSFAKKTSPSLNHRKINHQSPKRPIIKSREAINQITGIGFKKGNLATTPHHYRLKSQSTTLKTLTNP